MCGRRSILSKATSCSTNLIVVELSVCVHIMEIIRCVFSYVRTSREREGSSIIIILIYSKIYVRKLAMMVGIHMELLQTLL